MQDSCCGKCKTDEVKQFNYIEEAHVTASDKFYGGRVGFEVFAASVRQAVYALQRLDAVKKALFYGKGPIVGNPEYNDCNGLPLYVGYDEQTGRNIIHGIIGVATEAGELLELLQATVIEGKSFDAVNLLEENGDIFWYQALLAKASNFTFEQSQARNIAKLRARFGDKFSEYDANNRNVKIERAVLETKLEGKKTFEGLHVKLTGVQGCGKTVAANMLEQLLQGATIESEDN